MNITTIKNDYAKARKLNAEGQIMQAAWLFVSVQKNAKNSRSKFAPALAMEAHCAAVTAIDRARKAGKQNGEINELGRVRAESYCYLHGVAKK